MVGSTVFLYDGLQIACMIGDLCADIYSPPGYMGANLTQLSRRMTQETTHHHTAVPSGHVCSIKGGRMASYVEKTCHEMF